MAADCPVVCMHASSMPEVCGDAAEYAFPDQPESLRAAIERVAFSPERAEALRVLGRERLKLFSWRECARQHSELYQNLV
jgi:glycosyltransferase involved in cell wall biosynthesis